MDAVSYSHSAKQAQRIEKIVANPDSTDGVVTVPSVIGSTETINIPAGRTAVLPNVTVEGTLVIDGDVFVPSGSTFGDLGDQIDLKANVDSPALTGTPTLNSGELVKLSADGLRIEKSDNTSIKNQCTAWVNFDGTTTPPTIRDSYNVSSVIRTATGVFDVYFDGTMDNSNYSISAGGIYNENASDNSLRETNYYTINKFTINLQNGAGTNVNHYRVDIQVFGGKN